MLECCCIKGEVMCSNHYKLTSESASIVLVGYPLQVTDFRNLFKKIDFLTKYDIHEAKAELQGINDIPKEKLDTLLKSLPIAVFTSQKHKFDIVLLENEQKLSFSILNFDIKNLCMINEIIDNLLDCNLSSISQIGFNFSNVFEFNNKKLKLLNENIEDITVGTEKVWNKNKTFILTLPFDFDDHTSTYKIQKMLPIQGEKLKKRIYKIDVNQNFTIEREKNLQKNSDIIAKIHRLESLYCNEFRNMCNEFLKMYYE